MSDTFSVYPPGTTREEMDKASGYVANEFEWAATQLNKGDQCWFRKRNGRFGTGEELGPWKWGTYLSSYFYDGMIARVAEADPDDLIEHSLFLDLGDQISATRP